MREISYCTFNLVMASRSVIVSATVLSIRENVCYPCCWKCHRRVRTHDQQRFWCELCREEYSSEEQLQYRYRVSVLASDRTQLAHIIVFGSCLNKFFGASATDFTRFVANLRCNEIALPCSRLVKLAIDRCFIGSTLQFGFRVCPTFGRTASQIARNSPFHLKNILNKQLMTVTRTRQFDDVPNLLACQVVRCSSSEESPTVLETLEGYLDDLSNNTSHLLEFPASMKLECSTSNPISNCKPCLTNESPFTQRPCPSPMCCSAPHALGGSLAQSPLVLTGVSQSSSGEMTMQGKNSNHLQHSCLLEQSDHGSFFQKERQDSLEILQSMEGVFSSAPTEDSKELPLSPKDESYFMDFPSSEDLSAFLADIVLDENVINNDVTQSVLSLDSIKEDPTAHVMTVEGLTTSQDCSEFIEFPSSEELDAFLADIETDCSDVSVPRAFNPGTSRSLNADSNSNGDKSVLQGVSTHPCNETMNEDKTHKDTVPHHYRCGLTKTTTKSRAIRDGQNMVEFSHTKYKERLPENFLANTVSSLCLHLENNETANRRCSNGASVMVRDNQLTGSEHVLSDIKRTDENQKQSVAFHTSSELEFVHKHRRSKLQLSEECSEEIRKRFDLCETSKQIVQCDAIVTLEDSRQTYLRSDISRPPIRIRTEEPRSRSSRHLLTHNQENTHAVSRSPREKNTSSGSELECLQCSPELFSQSYTREEQTFNKTPDLFSSPRIFEGHEQSFGESECSNTPDLFSPSEDLSYRTHSRVRHDLDSLSLFSNSCSSCVSWASSPDYQPQQKRLALEKDVKKNFDLTNSCHSTPVTVLQGLASVRSLSRLWTPSKRSPLVVGSVSGKWNDNVSLQGTPSLFSQISNSDS